MRSSWLTRAFGIRMLSVVSDPIPDPEPEELVRDSRPSLLELLATWEPLEEEFPEIDDLEPVENVDF